MNKGNKIVVITDNMTIKEKLLAKINLVRGSDIVEAYTSSNMINLNSEIAPELIIIYVGIHDKKVLEILSEIKNFSACSSVPILLVCEKIEQDFLLSAFDEGISDYILIDAADTEFLMRIIWCLQKNDFMKKHNHNLQQLTELDVLHNNTFFYKEAYVDKIFENTITKQLDAEKNMSLLVLTPDIDCKYKLSTALLGNIIKGLVRTSDLVGIKDDNKFYILLNDTTDKNVEYFFARIRDELVPDYTISGGVSAVTTNFETAETQAKTALQDALTQKDKLIVYAKHAKKKRNTVIEDDDSDMTVPHKNFKLFKLSFMKKLNNVITPTFYQYQKMYEEKLFETKIDQIASEGESRFVLTAPNIKSSLVINYPGFSAVNIKMVHATKKDTDESFVSLNLSELDNAKMNKIMDKFIQRYREISDN